MTPKSRHDPQSGARELARIRRRLGWTQAQLAEALGVAANTVARIERGERGISEPLLRLARTLRKEAP